MWKDLSPFKNSIFFLWNCWKLFICCENVKLQFLTECVDILLNAMGWGARLRMTCFTRTKSRDRKITQFSSRYDYVTLWHQWCWLELFRIQSGFRTLATTSTVTTYLRSFACSMPRTRAPPYAIYFGLVSCNDKITKSSNPQVTWSA